MTQKVPERGNEHTSLLLKKKSGSVWSVKARDLHQKGKKNRQRTSNCSGWAGYRKPGLQQTEPDRPGTRQATCGTSRREAVHFCATMKREKEIPLQSWNINQYKTCKKENADHFTHTKHCLSSCLWTWDMFHTCGTVRPMKGRWEQSQCVYNSTAGNSHALAIISLLVPEAQQLLVFQVPSLETLGDVLSMCHLLAGQLTSEMATSTQHLGRAQNCQAERAPDQESKSYSGHRDPSSTSPFQLPNL